MIPPYLCVSECISVSKEKAGIKMCLSLSTVREGWGSGGGGGAGKLVWVCRRVKFAPGDRLQKLL